MEQTTTPCVTVDVTPCRIAYREAAFNVAERCYAEVDRIGRMLDSQRRSKVRRKSLRPGVMARRVQDLMTAAKQARTAAQMATAEINLDDGSRTWALPRLPTLDAWNLVPVPQGTETLAKLGSYSRLYRGKYRALYGVKR